MTSPNEKPSVPAVAGVGRRGPKGEHGEIGETGEVGKQGERGHLGATGEPGERGRLGATGEQGERGGLGATGEQGERGRLGATGEQGLRGLRGASLSAIQVLVLFVTVVAVSLLLAFRSEINANNIKANTRNIAIEQYDACVASVTIYSRINDADTALADIERTQTIDPVLAQKRIDAYLSARVLPLPTCGVRPR